MSAYMLDWVPEADNSAIGSGSYFYETCIGTTIIYVGVEQCQTS